MSSIDASPPPDRQISERTWEAFFLSQDKNEALGLYLRDWPALTPNERFEPPHEFSTIQKSVHEHPLTILLGPPAAGKTFISLQLLWEEFQQERPVGWIAATTYVPTASVIA